MMAQSSVRKIFEKAAAPFKWGVAAFALAALPFLPGAMNDNAQAQELTDYQSNTAYSQKLRALEEDKEFKKERPGNTPSFVFMNLDEIGLNQIIDGYDSRTAAAQAVPEIPYYMQDYFRKRTGLDVPVEKFFQFQELLLKASDSNIPHMEQAAGITRPGGNIAMIFTYSPDTDATSQMREKLLNLSPFVHGNFARFPLSKNVRPEVQQEVTLEHEIAHSFGPDYGAEANRLQEAINNRIREDLYDRVLQERMPPDVFDRKSFIAHRVEALFSASAYDLTAEQERTVRQIEILRHKNEMFRDIVGVIRVSQKGFTGVALERAYARAAGAALGGPRTYHVKDLSFSSGPNTGFIYSPQKGLRAAQKEIDKRGDALRDMTYSDILTLAERLTEENALDINAALGSLFLWHSLNNLGQVGLTDMTVWRLTRNRELYDYQAAYDYAQNAAREMNEALAYVFDLRGVSPGLRPLDMLTFRFDQTDKVRAVVHYEGDTMKTVDFLKKELQKKAAEKTDIDSLVVAFEQYKDELRQRLSSPSPKVRDAMTYGLAILPTAFRHALKEAKYGAPPSQEELERRVREQQEQQQNQKKQAALVP